MNRELTNKLDALNSAQFKEIKMIQFLTIEKAC